LNLKKYEIWISPKQGSSWHQRIGSLDKNSSFPIHWFSKCLELFSNFFQGMNGWYGWNSFADHFYGHTFDVVEEPRQSFLALSTKLNAKLTTLN